VPVSQGLTREDATVKAPATPPAHRPCRPWSADELGTLRAYYADRGRAWVAGATGRSQEAVRRKAQEVGLDNPPKGRPGPKKSGPPAPIPPVEDDLAARAEAEARFRAGVEERKALAREAKEAAGEPYPGMSVGWRSSAGDREPPPPRPQETTRRTGPLEFTIRRPSDMHVHFRDGDMLRAVAPHTAAHFGRAVVMPNVPAIETGCQAFDYACRIDEAVGDRFVSLMTIKLTHRTTPEAIRLARRQPCVVAAKLYPSGVTTASHDGIADVEALAPVLAAMQECGMVLCVHGEEPGSFVLDRERDYLERVRWIVRNFPGLKVVLEHVTTEDAVRFVGESSVNVAATITAHHLMLTLDDVLGSGIRPHHFCYPVAKRPDDRSALRRAALGNAPGRFFFGSDSAPHLRGAKESACGCAGIFSAPTALAVLAGWFVEASTHLGSRPGRETLADAAAKMERFCSTAGPEFYGLPEDRSTITLAREDWVPPAEVGGVVVYRGGETLPWRVVERGAGS
jgi:dihydroorotase